MALLNPLIYLLIIIYILILFVHIEMLCLTKSMSHTRKCSHQKMLDSEPSQCRSTQNSSQTLKTPLQPQYYREKNYNIIVKEIL